MTPFLKLASLTVLLAATSLFAQTPSGDMAQAANNLLASLNAEQKAKTVFELKSDERVNWHFVPKARNGLPFKEMTPSQKHLAHTLLNSALSHRGYFKVTTMMSVEQILFELENSAPRRDADLYYFTIFGEPGKDVWGWRVEGHHISMNFTARGETVLATTPSFLGINPAEVQNGPRKGLRVLAAEEDLARQLVQSLDEKQRKTAILSGEVPRDIITGNSRNAKRLEPVGLAAKEMTDAQQKLLKSLINEYLGRNRSEIAAADWKKIEAAGFGKITFAWAGALEAGKGHYYRVQGETFLLEYDNTQNNANHIHAVWRDFENDFGDDLLRKHYETAHPK